MGGKTFDNMLSQYTIIYVYNITYIYTDLIKLRCYACAHECVRLRSFNKKLRGGCFCGKTLIISRLRIWFVLAIMRAFILYIFKQISQAYIRRIYMYTRGAGCCGSFWHIIPFRDRAFNWFFARGAMMVSHTAI